MIDVSFKNIYSFVSYETTFVVLSTIINAFFVLYFLGFLKNKNALVETISFYLKLFIGAFLVLKFNPVYSFTNQGDKFTRLDKKVVFSAGMYILIINGIEFYNKYVSKQIKKEVNMSLDATNTIIEKNVKPIEKNITSKWF
jgi:hypothetical protein